VIHPKQIAAANAAFEPSDGELDDARQIVAAWQQARSTGKGLAVVNGKLVENLHVQEAERLLAMAEAIAANVAKAP
jgi:citrate lyase subunit beta/citryl-CoA lyase